MALYDWAVNIDGVLSEHFGGDVWPAVADVSGFDTATGLGTIAVTVSGPGAHFVGLFLDHEIDETVNGFTNETGASFGSPAAGQSWEIDEPGWVNGDIYGNLTSGSLDNTIGTSVYGDTTFPDDVSMAIGWNFVLADLPGVVRFNLSDVAPVSGFYLQQSDPDSQVSVNFSSDFSVVPLPGAVLLGALGLGTAGSLVGRFQRRRMQK
jgi:hypothetical protein